MIEFTFTMSSAGAKLRPQFSKLVEARNSSNEDALRFERRFISSSRDSANSIHYECTLTKPEIHTGEAATAQLGYWASEAINIRAINILC